MLEGPNVILRLFIEDDLEELFALELDGGKMHSAGFRRDAGEIGRANLDGSIPELLISATFDFVTGIALDRTADCGQDVDLGYLSV